MPLCFQIKGMPDFVIFMIIMIGYAHVKLCFVVIHICVKKGCMPVFI